MNYFGWKVFLCEILFLHEQTTNISNKQKILSRTIWNVYQEVPNHSHSQKITTYDKQKNFMKQPVQKSIIDKLQDLTFSIFSYTL